MRVASFGVTDFLLQSIRAVTAFAVCTQGFRRFHSHRLVTESTEIGNIQWKGKIPGKVWKVSRLFGISDLA